MGGAGDAGRQPVQDRTGGDAAVRDPGLGVGLVEFLLDALQVEQVGGGLRHQADEPPGLRRRELPGSRRAGPSGSPTETEPALRGPEPWSAQSREDLPEPLRPIRAVTSPPRRSRSTSRTAGTPWYVTVMPRALSRAGRSVPERAAPVAGRSRPARHGGGRGPSGVADGERQRGPAGGAAEFDDRRCDGRGAEDLGGRPGDHPPVAGEVEDAVGVLDDPLQAVFGEEHGDAEVVDEPGDGGEHLLGGGRVERGGGLVEDEDPGWAVRTEPMATRCCCPPESSCSARWRRSARPSRSRVSSTRLRMVAGGTANCSMV